MFRHALRLVLVGLALSACATTGDPGSSQREDPQVERGRALAQRRCAGCHAIGLDEPSYSAGPRFRDLEMRNNSLSLAKRLKEISAHGSGEMLALEITPSDAQDLVAYFMSLNRRAP